MELEISFASISNSFLHSFLSMLLLWTTMAMSNGNRSLSIDARTGVGSQAEALGLGGLGYQQPGWTVALAGAETECLNQVRVQHGAHWANIKVSRSSIPFWRLQRRMLPSFSHFPEATYISWLMAPSSIFEASSVASRWPVFLRTPLSLTLSSASLFHF